MSRRRLKLKDRRIQALVDVLVLVQVNSYRIESDLIRSGDEVVVCVKPE